VLIESYLPLTLAATTSNLLRESHFNRPENAAFLAASVVKFSAEVTSGRSPRVSALRMLWPSTNIMTVMGSPVEPRSTAHPEIITSPPVRRSSSTCPLI
jgi:hypothetical protein